MLAPTGSSGALFQQDQKHHFPGRALSAAMWFDRAIEPG
jgi:hypothetical protein